MIFSGFLSSSGSAIGSELEVDAPDIVRLSMEKRDRLRWNGGSNQNQRSLGNCECISTSAIKKRSRNAVPLGLQP